MATMADVNISTSSKIATNLTSHDSEVMIIDDEPLLPVLPEVPTSEIIEILYDTELPSKNEEVRTDATKHNLNTTQEMSTNPVLNTQEVMVIENNPPQATSIEAPIVESTNIADATPTSSEKNSKIEANEPNTQIDEINLIYGDIIAANKEKPVDVPAEDAPDFPADGNNFDKIEINFSNGELFSKYREKFLGFLNTLKDVKFVEEGNRLIYVEKSMNDDALSEREVVINPEEIDLDEYDDDTTKKKRKRRERDRRKERKDDKDKLFSIDTEPSNEVSSNLFYRSKYKVIDDDPLAEEQDGNEKEAKPEECQKIVCFNCSGEHALKDCTLPRDNYRIRGARQKMIYNNVLVRYHEGNDHKYAHLKPGVLSEKLRNALGVRKYDIPAHVYKMRVMGYPPGWLEAAKVLQSNLVLFDSNGRQDACSKVETKYSLDPERIVDYPGFNCKPLRGSKDEYRSFCVPPYSTALSKENMIDFFNKSIHDSEEGGKRSPSPTLVDLEAQKKQLLEQLTCNDDSNTQTTLDLDLSVEQSSPENVTIDLDKTAESVLNITPEENQTPPAKSAQQSTPVLSLINSSSAGTPIIKPLSPYARLPNLDKFQKDVSPVINFENLPNSTGKYEQMTTVLEKVRNTMKSRLHNTST